MPSDVLLHFIGGPASHSTSPAVTPCASRAPTKKRSGEGKITVYTGSEVSAQTVFISVDPFDEEVLTGLSADVQPP
jgi:hypothetical protein